MSELNEILREYDGANVLIYGTGWLGQNLRSGLGGRARVVAFSNSYGERRELLGLPVLPLEEALERCSVTLVIVAAQMVTCRLIAEKIGALCREKGAALISAQGRDLLARREAAFSLGHMRGVTKAELRESIMSHEAVSFDLFDTLVTRNILYPSDVLALVEARLLEDGICIEDFCRRRRESERRLGKERAPRLIEIYRDMLSDAERQRVSAEELAEREWRADCDVLIPREEVCELFREAAAAGKRVYVVTDTWYGEEQIRQLLRSCGVEKCCRGVFASCEHGVGKAGGLFRFLLEKERAEALLHIGDDHASDALAAKAEGIECLRVFSAYELLDGTGGLALPLPEDLSGRIKLGMFISRLFNSPFQFETREAPLHITDACDFGYLYYGAVLGDLALWLQSGVRSAAAESVWFCARDGYLMQKLCKKLECGTGSVYLLTSRVAAMRTGLYGTEDILRAERSAFHGNLEAHLRERYGVDIAAVPEEEQSDADGVLRFQSAIIKASEAARRNTLGYLAGVDGARGDIALFDGVGRGTVQLYLQKLVKRRIKGFYLLRLDDGGQEEYGALDATSFYTPEERDGSAMFDTYYLLEFILTSPDPCLLGFREDGTPEYAAESRTREQIQCCMRAQRGVLEYFDTYLRICPKERRRVDKALDDAFLALMRRISMEDRVFLSLARDDPMGNHNETAAELLLQG